MPYFLVEAASDANFEDDEGVSMRPEGSPGAFIANTVCAVQQRQGVEGGSVAIFVHTTQFYLLLRLRFEFKFKLNRRLSNTTCKNFF